jgi:hypothetical protein
MNKEKSKELILEKWGTWKEDPNNATYDEMSEFYDWLDDKHPELINWRVAEGIDRWQDVRGWLNKRTGMLNQ